MKFFFWMTAILVALFGVSKCAELVMSIEISTAEYEILEEWKTEFPELVPEINEALASEGKITDGEYSALKQRRDKIVKNKVKERFGVVTEEDTPPVTVEKPAPAQPPMKQPADDWQQ